MYGDLWSSALQLHPFFLISLTQEALGQIICSLPLTGWGQVRKASNPTFGLLENATQALDGSDIAETSVVLSFAPWHFESIFWCFAIRALSERKTYRTLSALSLDMNSAEALRNFFQETIKWFGQWFRLECVINVPIWKYSGHTHASPARFQQKIFIMLFWNAGAGTSLRRKVPPEWCVSDGKICGHDFLEDAVQCRHVQACLCGAHHEQGLCSEASRQKPNGGCPNLQKPSPRSPEAKSLLPALHILAQTRGA